MPVIPNPNFKRNNNSKYLNTSCKCFEGHVHDSMGEAGYCNNLRFRVIAKDIKSYKSQVKYELRCNGELIANHYIDFEVILNNGNKEVHEYKGVRTAVWSIKHKLFKANYPKIPYIIINHK